MQSFIERLYNSTCIFICTFNRVNKFAKNIRCKYSNNIIVSKIFVNNGF